MFVVPPERFEWPAPWIPIRDENQCLEYPRIMSEAFGEESPESCLVAELHREVCPGHPLYGRLCQALAQSTDDPNEFVFSTDHPEYPIAFVHLTWTVETSPTFPYTIGYSSWEKFRHAWLKEGSESGVGLDNDGESRK